MTNYYIFFQGMCVSAGCEDEAVTKAYRMIQDNPHILRIEEVEEDD
jgi:hypothetical protein